MQAPHSPLPLQMGNTARFLTCIAMGEALHPDLARKRAFGGDLRHEHLRDSPAKPT